MNQYFIAYLGGNPPASQEEGKAHFARYQQWLQNLGDAVISPANPFKDTHTLNADHSIVNESATTMSGFTIVQAESMQEVLDMCTTCPFLEIGGRLEISELVQMPGM